MPVSILFCSDLPKNIPKKTVRVKKMEPTEVTICFEIKVLKTDIPVQSKEEEVWRDNMWKQILKMQNIDNKIPMDHTNNFFNNILKEDFKADVTDLKSAIASTICIEALGLISSNEEAKPQGGLSAPASAPLNQLVEMELS